MVIRDYIKTIAFLSLMTVNAFAQQPGVSRVYEYTPAPGQFVNTLPAYEDGDTPQTMADKCTASLAEGEVISLGAYGGYIVCGFDHSVVNQQGKYDLQILGNAFYATGRTDGGSSEPGIVMVSRDVNGNGLPDDPWYELAGSEYSNPQTHHNYTITYTRSDEAKERIPDPKNRAINDTTYCPWTDNLGRSGHVYRNMFHNQSYWPQWISGDQLTFRGTLLPGNAIDESGKGTYWVLYCYGYGYTDNRPNDDPEHRCMFNIDWAVDASGNPVHLPSIDFIKVYTGQNQYCGMLGETSTEFSGANDLHLLGQDIDDDVPSGITIHTTTVQKPQRTYELRLSSRKKLIIQNGKKFIFNIKQ